MEAMRANPASGGAERLRLIPLDEGRCERLRAGANRLAGRCVGWSRLAARCVGWSPVAGPVCGLEPSRGARVWVAAGPGIPPLHRAAAPTAAGRAALAGAGDLRGARQGTGPATGWAGGEAESVEAPGAPGGQRRGRVRPRSRPREVRVVGGARRLVEAPGGPGGRRSAEVSRGSGRSGWSAERGG
jgi:hypothetical protein